MVASAWATRALLLVALVVGSVAAELVISSNSDLGSRHALRCARSEQGGCNSNYRPSVTLAAGDGHTCFAACTGLIHCSGNNDAGQCGRPTTTASFNNFGKPVLGVDGLPLFGTWVEVGAQASTTCARNISGDIYCWGRGFTSQAVLRSPPSVPSKQMVVGDGTFCAILSQSPFATYCIGGPLNGTSLPFSEDLALIGKETLCVLYNDKVSCCGPLFETVGGNKTAVCGQGMKEIFLSASFTELVGLTSSPHTLFGYFASPALAVGWGRGTDGNLGQGSTIDWGTVSNPVSSMVAPKGTTKLIQIAAGDSHSCVIVTVTATYQAIRCTGGNALGQLGTNSSTSSYTFANVSIPAGYTAVSVAVGGAHTCAIISSSIDSTDKGRVMCWGSNAKGQLGQAASVSSSATPIYIKGLFESAYLRSVVSDTCSGTLSDTPCNLKNPCFTQFVTLPLFAEQLPSVAYVNATVASAELQSIQYDYAVGKKCMRLVEHSGVTCDQAIVAFSIAVESACAWAPEPEVLAGGAIANQIGINFLPTYPTSRRRDELGFTIKAQEPTKAQCSLATGDPETSVLYARTSLGNYIQAHQTCSSPIRPVMENGYLKTMVCMINTRFALVSFKAKSSWAFPRPTWLSPPVVISTDPSVALTPPAGTYFDEVPKPAGTALFSIVQPTSVSAIYARLNPLASATLRLVLQGATGFEGSIDVGGLGAPLAVREPPTVGSWMPVGAGAVLAATTAAGGLLGGASVLVPELKGAAALRVCWSPPDLYDTPGKRSSEHGKRSFDEVRFILNNYALRVFDARTNQWTNANASCTQSEPSAWDDQVVQDALCTSVCLLNAQYQFFSRGMAFYPAGEVAFNPIQFGPTSIETFRYSLFPGTVWDLYDWGLADINFGRMVIDPVTVPSGATQVDEVPLGNVTQLLDLDDNTVLIGDSVFVAIRNVPEEGDVLTYSGDHYNFGGYGVGCIEMAPGAVASDYELYVSLQNDNKRIPVPATSQWFTSYNGCQYYYCNRRSSNGEKDRRCRRDLPETAAAAATATGTGTDIGTAALRGLQTKSDRAEFGNKLCFATCFIQAQYALTRFVRPQPPVGVSVASGAVASVPKSARGVSFANGTLRVEVSAAASTAIYAALGGDAPTDPDTVVFQIESVVAGATVANGVPLVSSPATLAIDGWYGERLDRGAALAITGIAFKRISPPTADTGYAPGFGGAALRIPSAPLQACWKSPLEFKLTTARLLSGEFRLRAYNGTAWVDAATLCATGVATVPAPNTLCTPLCQPNTQLAMYRRYPLRPPGTPDRNIPASLNASVGTGVLTIALTAAHSQAVDELLCDGAPAAPYQKIWRLEAVAGVTSLGGVPVVATGTGNTTVRTRPDGAVLTLSTDQYPYPQPLGALAQGTLDAAGMLTVCWDAPARLEAESSVLLSRYRIMARVGGAWVRANDTCTSGVGVITLSSPLRICSSLCAFNLQLQVFEDLPANPAGAVGIPLPGVAVPSATYTVIGQTSTGPASVTISSELIASLYELALRLQEIAILDGRYNGVLVFEVSATADHGYIEQHDTEAEGAVTSDRWFLYVYVVLDVPLIARRSVSADADAAAATVRAGHTARSAAGPALRSASAVAAAQETALTPIVVAAPVTLCVPALYPGEISVPQAVLLRNWIIFTWLDSANDFVEATSTCPAGTPGVRRWAPSDGVLCSSICVINVGGAVKPTPAPVGVPFVALRGASGPAEEVSVMTDVTAYLDNTAPLRAIDSIMALLGAGAPVLPAELVVQVASFGSSVAPPASSLGVALVAAPSATATLNAFGEGFVLALKSDTYPYANTAADNATLGPAALPLSVPVHVCWDAPASLSSVPDSVTVHEAELNANFHLRAFIGGLWVPAYGGCPAGQFTRLASGRRLCTGLCYANAQYQFFQEVPASPPFTLPRGGGSTVLTAPPVSMSVPAETAAALYALAGEAPTSLAGTDFLRLQVESVLPLPATMQNGIPITRKPPPQPLKWIAAAELQLSVYTLHAAPLAVLTRRGAVATGLQLGPLPPYEVCWTGAAGLSSAIMDRFYKFQAFIYSDPNNLETGSWMDAANTCTQVAAAIPAVDNKICTYICYTNVMVRVLTVNGIPDLTLFTTSFDAAPLHVEVSPASSNALFALRSTPIPADSNINLRLLAVTPGVAGVPTSPLTALATPLTTFELALVDTQVLPVVLQTGSAAFGSSPLRIAAPLVLCYTAAAGVTLANLRLRVLAPATAAGLARTWRLASAWGPGSARCGEVVAPVATQGATSAQQVCFYACAVNAYYSVTEELSMSLIGGRQGFDLASGITPPRRWTNSALRAAAPAYEVAATAAKRHDSTHYLWAFGAGSSHMVPRLPIAAPFAFFDALTLAASGAASGTPAADGVALGTPLFDAPAFFVGDLFGSQTCIVVSGDHWFSPGPGATGSVEVRNPSSDNLWTVAARFTGFSSNSESLYVDITPQLIVFNSSGAHNAEVRFVFRGDSIMWLLDNIDIAAQPCSSIAIAVEK